MILFQMNNPAFTHLLHSTHGAVIARQEVEASEHPARYRAKAMMLTLAGPAVILAVSIGLILLTVWLARQIGGDSLPVLLVALIIAAYLNFALLRIRVPEPQGIRIRRRDAPELFELLNKISRKLKMDARVHQVLITDRFDVALIQTPRWGLIGPSRNYLQLGLPLLQGLSVKQLAAVVTHALAPLSGATPADGRWIFRQRNYWNQLHGAMQDGYRWSQQWLAAFIGLYVPYLNAYTQALLRQQYFNADQAAIKVAGQAACADALILLNLKARFLQEQYWPQLMQQADRQPEPAKVAPYTGLRAALATCLNEAPCQRWLQDALNAVPADAAQPTLRERLEYIGAFPQLPKPAGNNAAQQLLGGRLSTLQDELDTGWRCRIATEWQQRHRQVQAARTRLTQLNQQVASGCIELDDAYRRAHLTEELESPAAARALYLEILSQHPEHAPTSFAAGRLLLADGNEAGLALLETAMRLDPKAMIPSCRLAYDFLQRRGRSSDAENYYQQACERAALEDRALAERVSVSVSDTLLAHDLRPAQLARLQAQLAKHPSIRRAWLTCKQVQYFADRSLYVLLVERRRWPLHSAGDDARFARELVETLEMPGQSFVLVLNNHNRELKKRARQLPNAAIYPAG